MSGEVSIPALVITSSSQHGFLLWTIAHQIAHVQLHATPTIELLTHESGSDKIEAGFGNQGCMSSSFILGLLQCSHSRFYDVVVTVTILCVESDQRIQKPLYYILCKNYWVIIINLTWVISVALTSVIIIIIIIALQNAQKEKSRNGAGSDK